MNLREQHRSLLNQIFFIPKKSPFSWSDYGLTASGKGAVSVKTSANKANIRKWFKRVGLTVEYLKYIPQGGFYRVVFVLAEIEQEATL